MPVRARGVSAGGASTRAACIWRTACCGTSAARTPPRIRFIDSSARSSSDCPTRGSCWLPSTCRAGCTRSAVAVVARARPFGAVSSAEKSTAAQRCTIRPPASDGSADMTSSSGQSGSRRRRVPSLRMPAGRVSRVVGRIVVGLVLLFAFTALYVAAYHSPRARHVDIGVVGTPAQATQVQVALDAEHRGSFDVRTYAGESQARAALLRNQVEGVFVPSAPHARVLLAQALGVTPTETVTAALQRITAGSRAPATVQDLRPLPAILVLMLLGVSSVGGAVTYEFEPG